MNNITKLFLPLFLTFDFAHASEQLILIVSNDFNNTHAVLTRYENGQNGYKQAGGNIIVNIGRNGLAWGVGERGFIPKAGEPIKKEGDGRAPAGIFHISKAFGYAPTLKTKMPYLQADKQLICVDDSQSKDYNKIIDKNSSDNPKSFEWMRRDDNLYKIGLVVEHNTVAKKGAGSCIFFHIRKSEDAPTAGCSAMKEEDLHTIIKWLNPAKNPKVVQIPSSYCSEAKNLYNGIVCP
ncbi:MAG: L,D-transpeptidase family protein [Sulfurimonadaceae bacterium]